MLEWLMFIGLSTIVIYIFFILCNIQNWSWTEDGILGLFAAFIVGLTAGSLVFFVVGSCIDYTPVPDQAVYYECFSVNNSSELYYQNDEDKIKMVSDTNISNIELANVKVPIIRKDICIPKNPNFIWNKNSMEITKYSLILPKEEK